MPEIKLSQLSLNRDDIYDDSWAVIIGIDRYKYSEPLKYAVNDASAVRDLLISKFNFSKDNIRLIKDEEATLQSIKSDNKNLKLAQWFLDPVSTHGPDFVKNRNRILDKSKIAIVFQTGENAVIILKSSSNKKVNPP